MPRRFVLGLASIALGLAVWTACTGDDPVSTATGAVGQPCNSGGTCNTADLKCVGGYCTLASGGTSGGDGGGSSSSGGTSGSTSSGNASSGNASSSGGSVACIDERKTIDAGTKDVECPNDDGKLSVCSGSNSSCCPGVGCVPAGATCAGGAAAWACTSSSNCTGADEGCFIIGGEWFPDAGGLCGTKFTSDAGTFLPPAQCAQQPSANFLQLCTHDDQCDQHTCRPVPIDFNGKTFVWGVCVVE